MISPELVDNNTRTTEVGEEIKKPIDIIKVSKGFVQTVFWPRYSDELAEIAISDNRKIDENLFYIQQAKTQIGRNMISRALGHKAYDFELDYSILLPQDEISTIKSVKTSADDIGEQNRLAA